MNVHLLIITQGSIGQSLAEVAGHMLGKLPIATTVIGINPQLPQAMIQQQLQRLSQLLQNQPILVLTDLLGCTPHNLACKIKHSGQLHVLTGVNLTMLLKIYNYAHMELSDLANKAVTAAQTGITLCEQKN